jgi:hypothetical protein
METILRGEGSVGLTFARLRGEIEKGQALIERRRRLAARDQNGEPWRTQNYSNLGNQNRGEEAGQLLCWRDTRRRREFLSHVLFT